MAYANALGDPIPIALSDEDEDILYPERRVLHRRDYFSEMSENEFRMRFRLTKNAALHVLSKIEHALEFPCDRNRPVTPMSQLLLALRYYATGAISLTLADLCGVSRATANRIVHKVSEALALLKSDYIQFPESDEEMKEEAIRNFKVARFPRVIGLIDCTHIKIKNLGGEQAEVYRNRKGFFSLNTQIIGNEQLKILDIVARWPGSAHDSTIFNSSYRRAMFEDGRYGDYVLLGDSGYASSNYMLTPIANPATRAEQLYNESQIRTRNCVERLFGVWKRRFPVLAIGSHLNLKSVFPVISATACLHNILRDLQDPEPIDDPDLDIDWNEVLRNDGDVNPPPGNYRTRTRDKFVTEYFARL